MQITFRNNDGRTMSWEIAELLSVDGQPYRGSGDDHDLLIGALTRLTTLEQLVGQMMFGNKEEPPNGCDG